MLHLHRIVADQQVFQVENARHRGGRFAFERGFAPTHNALVGFDLHEHIRPVVLPQVLRQGHTEDPEPGDAEVRHHAGESL